MSVANLLRKAAKLQEKVEAMRGEIAALLDRARAELDASARQLAPSTMRKVGRAKAAYSGVGRRRPSAMHPPERKGRVSMAGKKRPASPSGPLAPAVVKVLEQQGKPMKVAAILERLLSGGYQFRSPEPKKNLAARIYRLKGVKQVSMGLFTKA